MEGTTPPMRCKSFLERRFQDGRRLVGERTVLQGTSTARSVSNLPTYVVISPCGGKGPLDKVTCGYMPAALPVALIRAV